MTRERLLPIGLYAYGAVQLTQGLWMVLFPGSFFDAVGPFGARNDHYIRDAATWSLALGAGLVFAAARPQLPGARTAVLLVAAAQAALHTVNHVVDAGDADPGWVGVFDAVSLALFTGGLVALLLIARPTAAVR